MHYFRIFFNYILKKRNFWEFGGQIQIVGNFAISKKFLRKYKNALF